jgi:penicillin-binding protein 1A
VLDTEVLPAGVAIITERLLEQVVSNGTASAAIQELGFKAKAGGKTGTTNDYKDAWFIGFSGNLTTGVWVGFDQPKTIGEGAYGGKVALPIWVDIMNTALVSVPQPAALRAEPILTKASICRISGLLATEGCIASGNSYTEELPYDMVPQSFCTVHEGTPPPVAAQRPRGGGFWERVKRWFH